MTGILLVDKPVEWTSHDVVAKLRGVLKERRIGHSGTLDPMATGLLVVFLGRGTRAVEFAENHQKTYEAKLRLGVRTDTQDITGTVLSCCDAHVSTAQLEQALAKFRGDISQIPPMYSAIKVGGRKLYEIARKGGTVERRPRRVVIHSLRFVGWDDCGDACLEVVCSKGTYIRTLCYDIGEALGCGGCLSALRRTQAGQYSVTEASTLEQIICSAERGSIEELIMPVDTVFSDYPTWTVGAETERRIRSGGPIADQLPPGRYRAYTQDGHSFLALCDSDGQQIKLVKSFYEV